MNTEQEIRIEQEPCCLDSHYINAPSTIHRRNNLKTASIFTLKTHQMFSVHTKSEKFEDATVSSHFGFVFEENSGMEVTLTIVTPQRFRKAPFSKCFPFTLERKAGVFIFLRLV